MRYVDMIDAVLARCKGCPSAEAVDAMRNACMEFCTETYWLTTGNQIIVDGTQVELTDLETQVVDVIEARIADAKSERELDGRVRHTRTYPHPVDTPMQRHTFRRVLKVCLCKLSTGGVGVRAGGGGRGGRPARPGLGPPCG